MDAPAGVWAWWRGAAVTVVLNLGDDLVTVGGVEGVIRIATDRVRDGELVGGSLELYPWQGVVIEQVSPA
jgi:hypothetical protein